MNSETASANKIKTILSNPSLSRQLIAYIGNKRRLLPLLARAIEKCRAIDSFFAEDSRPIFVDYFAGSGAVARLAKLFDYSVIANDWEDYSYILNQAFLVTNQSDLAELFVEHGGLESLLTKLNNLENPDRHDRLISRLYAPAETATADPERERMFYTTENANRIDAIRGWIEHQYPGEILDERASREKNLLLGLLLYEAATHANTSGVFKAYHRGFGGRGKDALSRIMGRIELEYPALSEGEAEARREDANRLAARLAKNKTEVAIAYLDPPYNQHQYGSNYHLLNTIARFDRPRVASLPRTQDGKRRDKAGIRRDWVKTRSAFCSRASAEQAFADLVSKIKARQILVSYSTEGMIPIKRLVEILGTRGRLEIVLAEYTRYRGGKQALTTTTSNIEFVLIATTGLKNRAEDTRRVLDAIGLTHLKTLIKRAVSPAALLDAGYRVKDLERIDSGLVFERRLESGLLIRLEVDDFKRLARTRFFDSTGELGPSDLSDEDFSAVLGEVGLLTSITREEELEVTLNWATYLLETDELARLAQPLKEIPVLLKKFNDRKAYATSLVYLARSYELAREVRRRSFDEPKLERPLARFIRALEGISQRKLRVENPDRELNLLKKEISEHSQDLAANPD